MSRPQEPQRPSFPFGNPFSRMLPKGSYTSPKLHDLLNKFEEALADRFTKLKPTESKSVCSLSWMAMAMELLSETHRDIKSLIDELDLPLCNWEDKWVDIYLGNSVKLLDVCIAFSSEISRFSQGQLILQFLIHKLSDDSPNDLAKARLSLESWWQHIGSKNPRIENCCAFVEQLVQSLGLPKIKNSAKGKVLMQAMYGVRVQTIFTCSVFLAIFRRSNSELRDLSVPQTHSWADAYVNLQACVNKGIRVLAPENVVIKELGDVEESARALLCLTKEADEAGESEAMEDSISVLKKRTEILSGGVDLLGKEVDGFFQIVLGGRDALLCSIRRGVTTKDIEDPKKELRMR